MNLFEREIESVPTKTRKKKVGPQDHPPGLAPIMVLRFLAVTTLVSALISLTFPGGTAIALSWVAGSVLLIAYSYHLQLMEREAYWLRIEQWERDQRLQGLMAQNAEIHQQLRAAISPSKPAAEQQQLVPKPEISEPKRNARKRYKVERDESTRRELMAEINKATANVR
jgi:hypothetical protein